MVMRILITGGCGFVGSNLTKSLLNISTVKKIIIVDNFSQSDAKYIKKFHPVKTIYTKNSYVKSKNRVDIIRASVNDFDFAKKITKSVDYVIHLAAESGVDKSISQPHKSFQINVNGAMNYLESARMNKIKQFIFASSGAVFGDSKPPMKENNVKDPISPYGSSKLSIESFCETYSKVFNMKTTILRFSNAYGPFSDHKESIIAKYVKNIRDNRILKINGSAYITRDYIFIDDICCAVIKCLYTKKLCNTYHVGTGKETSIKDLIEKIKQICYKKDIQIPKIVVVKKRLGDMTKNYTSISKIKKEINWKPKFTLTHGLSETINYFFK